MPIIQTENGYIYKKTTKSTNSKMLFCLMLFLVSICIFVLCMFAFTQLNFTSILNMNKYVIYNDKLYYAVSLSSCDNIDELSNDITLVKMQDGAGYVYKSSNKYNLVANVYSSKQEAESVVQNLTSYNASVIEIHFDRLVMSSKYTSEQIQTLRYSIEVVDRFFETVSDISLSFDRGELLDAEVRQKLQIFKERCQEDKENLTKMFKDSSDVITTYVKIFQSEVISNLSSVIVSQNMSSDIKCMICSTLSSFENFQKNVKKWVMGLLKTIVNNFVKQNQVDTEVKVDESINKYDGINMSSLVVYAPKNIAELNKVIDCVAGGQSVIINFAGIKKVEYQTIVDYLSGALYAIRAKISRLENQLYVIMPKSVKLATL